MVAAVAFFSVVVQFVTSILSTFLADEEAFDFSAAGYIDNHILVTCCRSCLSHSKLSPVTQLSYIYLSLFLCSTLNYHSKETDLARATFFEQDGIL